MAENFGVPAKPPSEPPRWRKGTRTMRLRTATRAGLVPGQPYAPATNPAVESQGNPARHVCAECFGPRNAYRDGPFCFRCEKALFGDGEYGYTRFVRSQRRHMANVRRRWAAAGYVPGQERGGGA